MMTDAELTILSLAAEGPRYGYEIQQIIDERGLREWLTIGFSSIYYILNKLERLELLSSELRPEGRGPARKVYHLTEAGRGVLQTAIADLLRQPRSLGTGFELGLANLGALKPHQVYKVLSLHMDDLKMRLDSVEKSWERHQKDGAPEAADHIRALYTHSLALMRAELTWLIEFVESWEQRYPKVRDEARKPLSDAPERNVHNTTTRLHLPPSPDPAKMIQRLRRPKRPEEEE